MTVSVFDSSIYGGLFADDAVAGLFADGEQVRAMLRVEAALARAEAGSGLIPADAADRIGRVAEAFDPDPAGLAAGTAATGVPVGALVALLREEVGGEAASYVHWGATSQDIVDTALVLRLRAALNIIDERLDNLIRALLDLARRHRDSPMLSRTRSQAAVPTSFGLKAAGWAAPLRRHRQRLAELRPRVLRVQLGGAVGTRAALGDAQSDVAAGFARELGLAEAPLPWHVQRDGMAELAGWFSLVTGSIAKLGQDVLLLAQTDTGEISVQGGGSSTMPHKNNPVGAELLIALARHNACLVGEMHHALIHAHERDGASWSSEWIALPQMAVAVGGALNHAAALMNALTVDTDRMAANLSSLNDLVLAEAAVFALARHMPRQQAEQLVSEAARATRSDGRRLLDRLAEVTDAPVDWPALRRPEALISTAREILDDFLAREVA